jgi:hypothetical protein
MTLPLRKGEQVSPVATQQPPAPAAQWVRTPEGQARFAAHLAKVDRDYRRADPRLRALYKDATILDAVQVMECLNYSATSGRLYQLTMKSRDLALADQVPHPSAVPTHDAVRDTLQGFTRGMLARWAVQSGRLRIDPFTWRLVPMTGITFGGAPAKSL